MKIARKQTVFWTDELAELAGCDTRRMRRLLLSTGAGQKRGGRVIATRGTLAAHAPELLDLVMQAQVQAEFEASE